MKYEKKSGKTDRKTTNMTGFVTINAGTGIFYVTVGDAKIEELSIKATSSNAKRVGRYLASRADVKSWYFGSQIDLPEAKGVPKTVRSIIERSWRDSLCLS